MMTTTRILRTSRSQIIRIPEALQWPDNVKEVEVIQDGPSRIITPVDRSWDVWFAEPPADGSYPAERDQL
ncbi:type II toxin-antitoxin system VapB family antitoxin [Arthrobacter tumbae]|uniref:type II toxin-antitoxin system VapB family antitoxin n=1 Tax=Arthrobacter tumbae TaxID=163874 RepID=UPI003557FEBC